MITMVNSERGISVVSEMINDSTFQVLEYKRLMGINDMGRVGLSDENSMSSRQIRIILDSSTVKIQNECLSFVKGKLELQSSTNNISKITKMLFKKSSIAMESIKPSISGTGEVLLQPSLEYFTLIELEDEEVIVSDGIFIACEDSIEVLAENSGEHGEEIKLKGSGIAVLKLPVPENEVLRCKIYKDKLEDFNDMVILRTGKIKCLKSKCGSSRAEGYKKDISVKSYTGIGEVWIILNKSIYDEISEIDDEEDIKDEFDEDDE